ncbi:hypothetical protein ACF9IK_31280 [Kitasatospora hibisci]|uniref:hypothetical protein n=1 Tax=Kitasatospora hibisci TaxID=3369522 RepID=UPI003753F076
MPGTALTTPRRTAGRPARWLAAALLLPVLTACGGGGGSSSGSGAQSSAAGAAELGDTPPAEGQQPEGQRTKAGGNQGGFAGAGNVSASASGVWPDNIYITLKSTVTSNFTATVKEVHDCAGGSSSPASEDVTFSGGSAQVSVVMKPPEPKPKFQICLTVVAGGKSQSVKADTTVEVPDDANANGGGGNGGQNGGTTSGTTQSTTSQSSAGSGSTP